MNWATLVTLVIAVFVACVLSVAIWRLVKYAFVVLGLIPKTRKLKKRTGKECYLMLTTHRSPFQYCIEYENRMIMEEAQMNAWCTGCGAKEISKEEHDNWPKSKEAIEERQCQ